MLLKCPDQDISLEWIRTFLCPDHICLTLTISNGIPPSTSIPPFKRNPQGEYRPSRWISTDWIYSFWFEYILKKYKTQNTKITLNWHYNLLFFYFSSHIEHSFCQYMFKPIGIGACMYHFYNWVSWTSRKNSSIHLQAVR